MRPPLDPNIYRAAAQPAWGNAKKGDPWIVVLSVTDEEVADSKGRVVCGGTEVLTRRAAEKAARSINLAIKNAVRVQVRRETER